MGFKIVFGRWWLSLVFTTQFGATTLSKGYRDQNHQWRFASLTRNSLGWQLVLHTWDSHKAIEIEGGE